MTVEASPTAIREREIEHEDYQTAYLEAGQGPAVVLLHGSGPGVSARANWALTMTSDLAERFRFIAPDIVGFGKTAWTPDQITNDHRVRHIVSFLDAIGLGPSGVVGNSMGGGIALHVAHRRPDLVERLVLMGTSGVALELTPEIDQLYGYEPSVEAMEGIIRLMAFDASRVTPDLVRMRYEATLTPGSQERFAALFSPPRQRHIDDMALTDEALQEIEVPTLLIHGVHDRIVPIDRASLHLARLLPDADLVALGRCGHWAQVERGDRFRWLIGAFLSGSMP